MDIEELTVFCQSLGRVTTEILWDNVLVFKIAGKIFCMAPLDGAGLKMNLKCLPDEALELRERFPSVLPGYHMNKKYWNTVLADGSVSDNMLRIWIADSYRLVKAGLSRSERERWEQLPPDRENK